MAKPGIFRRIAVGRFWRAVTAARLAEFFEDSRIVSSMLTAQRGSDINKVKAAMARRHRAGIYDGIPIV